MKVTVINTGGTFNKRYNPIKGQLEVPADNIALDKIIASCHNVEFEIKNIVSKDSLDMIDSDREAICEAIKSSENDKVIIVHGTDTVHLTSELIKQRRINKKIVFTGAMVPMSIDEVEATMNFSQALGFLSADVEDGTYIAMHGVVVDCSKLVKNRELGQFLIQE
ncbi:asparaginase domain-containing protein [Halarcobacter bivalviorum]|uniref:Asparaginase n=1 Tax=Halarcobacter bivalviorum TaxID=663364 RepID=A0AAX2ADQ8_9BACT|nr:asparaginase domain-containing protein [Halarcobacter bivalviorum]AXH11758.1 asparaginase [Halarcobacter bivalviorum]RXK10886.1 asparaginase [Halarcobacter bivalviorum]